MSAFPEILKYADISPLYIKGKEDIKGNYRPVSVLLNLSKLLEKYIFEQMSQFFENIFSKYRRGFRKDFSFILEKWKRSVNNSKMFVALLADLSKAFDCRDRELLIAKLNAYGFSLTALKLVHNYLSSRKRQIKINSSCSSFLEIMFGVPQGSILRPLLLNIFSIDLFFIIEDTDVVSYADHNTPYVSDDNINGVIKSLGEVSEECLMF